MSNVEHANAATTETSLERSISHDARIFRARRFLLREFPAGLTRASHHLQIYDNYITNTRLSLRKQRDPRNDERTKLLRQKTILTSNVADASGTIDGISVWQDFALAEIVLSPAEYEVLSVFETNETRKNRYSHTHGGHVYAIDFYLGDLLGLTIATFAFDSDVQARDFTAPDIATLEITHNELFTGWRLAELTIDELRAKL